MAGVEVITCLQWVLQYYCKVQGLKGEVQHYSRKEVSCFILQRPFEEPSLENASIEIFSYEGVEGPG